MIGLLIATLLALTGPAGASQASNRTEVIGRVTDWNGCPLSAAQVVVRSAEGKSVSIETNQNGEFRVVDIPRGKATVLVTVAGFRDSSVDVVVTEETTVADSALLLARLTSERLGTVEGIVRDVRGAPIADATVSLMSLLEHKRVSQVRSDSRGRFSLSTYDPGQYVLTAAALGFDPAAQALVLGPQHPQVAPVQFTLTPGTVCR